MDYTIKNLRDVDDSAPEAGVDATQEMRFAQGDLDAVRTGVSLMAVKPGRRSAIAHRHDEAEEVYVIVAGSGRMKLDDDVIEVKAMDAIRVAPSVTRAFEAGPEGLEYLAVGQAHEGDGAVQPIEGFWPWLEPEQGEGDRSVGQTHSNSPCVAVSVNSC